MEDTQTLKDILETVIFIKDNAATKEEMGEIKASMVTKEYLDNKLADLRGDMVTMMRKEDTKVRTLVEILHEKKVLNSEDKMRLSKLGPFAQ